MTKNNEEKYLWYDVSDIEGECTLENNQFIQEDIKNGVITLEQANAQVAAINYSRKRIDELNAIHKYDFLKELRELIDEMKSA